MCIVAVGDSYSIIIPIVVTTMPNCPQNVVRVILSKYNRADLNIFLDLVTSYIDTIYHTL